VGFEQAHCQVVAGVDHWPDALQTFAFNHPGAKTFDLDLAIPVDWAATLTEPVEMVIGGPPCQGFSISGKRDPQDPRNKLYSGFVDAVAQLRPAYFVMENVPNLRSMAKGMFAAAIAHDFEQLGYHVQHQVLLASDFGVPQNRRRLFFVGEMRRNGHPVRFRFPEPSTRGQPVTCWEAISDLPEMSMADGAEYPVSPRSAFQVTVREGSEGVWNHQITEHTEQTRRTISLVPDGGNYKDLPVELQDTRKVNIAWTRLASSRPSYTIDTGHRHHFHYEYNRVPTVRESARIQAFSDNFKFMGSKTSQLKQVGNAVPPMLARALAQQILTYA
jgi:DNA (cytosine-5)-methyltransferase 1